jgi:hypothetical protein
MCREWKDSSTREEAEVRYNNIIQFWKTYGAAKSLIAAESMCQYLAWWRERAGHWGEWMRADMSIEESAGCPTTNLTEAVHSSWWRSAGNGKKNKTDLASATMHDSVRAIMQQIRYQMFLEGKLIGNGPSKDDLILRAAKRSGCMVKVAKAINLVTHGTENHGKGLGSASDSRPMTSNLVSDYDGNSHRPDQIAFTQSGRVRKRPHYTNTIEGSDVTLPISLDFIPPTSEYPPPSPPSSSPDGGRAMFSEEVTDVIYSMNESFIPSGSDGLQHADNNPDLFTPLPTSNSCPIEFESLEILTDDGNHPYMDDGDRNLKQTPGIVSETISDKAPILSPTAPFATCSSSILFPIQGSQVVLETPSGVPISWWHISRTKSKTAVKCLA